MKSPHAEPRRGPAEGFLVWQTAILCAFATWSLGGRAEGAIYWIGAGCWTSLAALYINPSWWERLRRRGASPLGYWGVVLAVIALGIVNAQTVRVDLLDGSYRFAPRSFTGYLPAALEQKRALAYGLLYSGVMVQALMLWSFLRSRAAILRLVQLLALNGLVLAITGAIFRLAGADKILGVAEPVADYFFASFRYHNHWTAYGLLAMGMCTALGIYHYLHGQVDQDARRQRREIFWFSALLLVSVTLPMSTARAGVLFNAVFWGIVLCRLAVSVLSRRGASLQSLGTRRWWALGGVSLVALILTGMSIWTVRDAMRKEWTGTVKQFEQLEAGEAFDAHRFSHAWRDTGKMIAAAPVAGWGLGSHRYAYNIFAGDEYRDADGNMQVIKEFAHNDWLQTIAELGIPAFLCLLATPVLLIVRLRKLGPPPIFSQWLLTSCGLILLLALFEFPLSNPAVLLHFFIQAALGLRWWKSSIVGV